MYGRDKALSLRAKTHHIMSVRVRFAPSPTGPLHIGGVRTALYNFLLARKHGGTFILRVEDTDQNRFVPGAEQYIMDSLAWLGLVPDESPAVGGPHAPYRQSERKAMYRQYADALVASDNGYYAFDSEDELTALRSSFEAEGKTFKYDMFTRGQLRNSLTLPAEEVQTLLNNGTPWVIRLKVPADTDIYFHDEIRGDVKYASSDLDDKVMLKSDGMPTYHLANVVDDHLMEITHVIRGEEWLPSTPVHVLLYRALGWEDTRPTFAHLPLLLKPNGKGKLSKRDGAELGIPVFPMNWTDPKTNETVIGFRESGYLPEATLNFLALLGWNSGTEQEIFNIAEMAEAFSLDRVTKAGARFDIQKANWFNQQYILHKPADELARLFRPVAEANGLQASDAELEAFCGLFRERVSSIPDFWTQGYYMFRDIAEYDEKNLEKKVLAKWNGERRAQFEQLAASFAALPEFDSDSIKASTEAFAAEFSLGFGDVLPVLRLAVSGTMQGPAVFDIMAQLGRDKSLQRLQDFYALCDSKTA
jgi:glutamyl-tRNA synthetase